MFELVFLGTSASAPSIYRGLPAIAVCWRASSASWSIAAKAHSAKSYAAASASNG